MSQFVYLEGLDDIVNGGFYNTSIIRQFSCDDTQCNGSILAARDSEFHKTFTPNTIVNTVAPSQFYVTKSRNPRTYASLKQFYDSSVKNDPYVDKVREDIKKNDTQTQQTLKEETFESRKLVSALAVGVIFGGVASFIGSRT